MQAFKQRSLGRENVLPGKKEKPARMPLKKCYVHMTKLSISALAAQSHFNLLRQCVARLGALTSRIRLHVITDGNSVSVWRALLYPPPPPSR